MSNEYDYNNNGWNDPQPAENGQEVPQEPAQPAAPYQSQASTDSVQPQQPAQPEQPAQPVQPAQNSCSAPTGAYHYTAGNMPGQAQENTYRAAANPAGSSYSGNQAQSAGYQSQGYQNTGYSGYQGSTYGYQGGPAGYQNQTRATGYQEGGSPYGYQESNPEPNPMAGYNVKTNAPRTKKKKSGSKTIIAAAIICAIIGGIGGGTAVGLAMRNNTAAAPAESVVEELPEAEAETDSQAETGTGEKTTGTGEKTTGSTLESGNSNVNTTVIDVTTNSEKTEMTPQGVYENYVNAVVAVYNEGYTSYFGQAVPASSSGSGFIISEDGYIITNNHVVAGAESLTVTMTSGEEYEATLIGTDPENDVALIKIDGEDLPTVSIGDSDAIEVGEQVAAIGNPLGELTNTLTVGYVSALDREITENGTPINMFQTDCVINSGNSGGPIFDMHGNVIGITTAKYSSSGTFDTASIEGIGFCIPINDAMSVVNDLLEYGYVKGRASLGITCQAVSSTITQYYGLPEGINVVTVQEGSAAEKAGLQPGDIITALDGEEITGMTEFRTMLKQFSAGDTAKLTVYRSSTAETLELTVTFDERVVTNT